METFRNRSRVLLASGILLLLVHPPAAGREEIPRIRFIPLSQSSGDLPSDLVRGLAQDHDGYLWIAGGGGLSRFDGWETHHYRHDPNQPGGLGSDRLTAVATRSDAPGPVWVGTTADGLMRLESPAGEVVRYRKGPAEAGGLLSDHITALAIDEARRLWIGTDAGLNRLDPETGAIAVADGALASSAIASVASLGEEGVWVGTASGELHRWSPEEECFVRIWSTTVPVTSVAVDARDCLWIGTAGKGLHRRPGAAGGPEPVPLGAARHVTALHTDSNGDLWVGTTEGLALRDRHNDSFTWMRHSPLDADSLADDHVQAIFEDRSRMLWIATEGGGTGRFNLDRQWFPHVRHHPERDTGLPHPEVRAIVAHPDGTLSIGTGGGLARWSPHEGGFLPAPSEPTLARANVNALLLDFEGALWIGSRGDGLLRRSREGALETFRHDPSRPGSLTHDNVAALLQDRGGSIYVGTGGGGLLHHDPATGEFVRLATESGTADFIHCLAEDSSGNLWVATPGDLFLRISGETSLKPFGQVFPNALPLSGGSVAAILPDANGIVWLGRVDAGLDRFDTATGEVVHFDSAVHALPGDRVVALAKDRNNLLWVVTRDGIARLNAMQNEFRVFGAEDGLLRAGFNPGAVARDGSGVLCFGGNDGFNLVDPARLPALPRPTRPVLTSFEFYGKTEVPREGGLLANRISLTEEIRLPYDKRLLFAFRFGNLDFRFPGRGRFRYRLEGHDAAWIPAGSDRRASYAGISPGRYEFRVQASLDGRDWPEETAGVRVVVVPPWWQSWWFRSLALAAALLAGLAGIRLFVSSRLRQMRSREAQLLAQRDKAEASLARQLRNRVVLELSTRDLGGRTNATGLFDEALAQIAADFGADAALLFRLGPPSEEAEAGSPRLRCLGLWNRVPATETQTGGLPSLEPDGALVERLLAAPPGLVLEGSDELFEPLRRVLPRGETFALVAAPTPFGDTANGLVLLVRDGGTRPWNGDDAGLLQALAGQLGLSIAQIVTSETEGRYRRHLEESRHQAEVANRAKSDFLAKMTHELRSPLGSVISFTELLLDDHGLDDTQRKSVEVIRNNSEHLLEVVNEILDLSKIEAGMMERNDTPFEFQPLLRSVFEMFLLEARRKGIEFHFSARSALPGEIVTDRAKLRQILVNLTANAIKFTSTGAVNIAVSSELTGGTRLAEGRRRRPVRVHFEVRDTGCGVHPEEMDRLFERYAQTESGRRSSVGTGLGLPIARDFVRLMGGEIEVESVHGEGTTFRFHIECDELAPSAEATEDSALSPGGPPAGAPAGRPYPAGEIRILIAEDRPDNRLLLRRILGKAGFSLAEVENGRDAVRKWREWNPQVILMDEEMPGMNGSEAAREIRALAAPGECPVIISLTAHPPEQARETAFAAGCTDLVSKPFRARDLLAVISKHLGLEGTLDEAA